MDKIPNFIRLILKKARELKLKTVLKKNQLLIRHVDCYHITIHWNIDKELIEFSFSSLVPMQLTQQLHKKHKVQPDNMNTIAPFINELVEILENIHKDKQVKLDVI